MSTNSKFEEMKAKHPEWSDEQIWTAISLDMEADAIIERKGQDVDPNDPDIIEEIIRGAMAWLDEVLPIVFEKVKEVFHRILNRIGEWVREGIAYVIENLPYFFSYEY